MNIAEIGTLRMREEHLPLRKALRTGCRHHMVYELQGRHGWIEIGAAAFHVLNELGLPVTAPQLRSVT